MRFATARQAPGACPLPGAARPEDLAVEYATEHNTQTTDVLAPVAGGLRWRTRDHDYADMLRRNRGLSPRRPGDDTPSREGATPPPGPDTSTGPAIATTPPGEGRAGACYSYHPHAYDGVCDGFTWHLREAPPGMRVDRYTGAVSWTPGEGGRFRVTLCARSLYGTASRQCWEICVRKAAPARRTVANIRYREALRRRSGQDAAGGPPAGKPAMPILWRTTRRRPAPVPRAAFPLRI